MSKPSKLKQALQRSQDQLQQIQQINSSEVDPNPALTAAIEALTVSLTKLDAVTADVLTANSAQERHQTWFNSAPDAILITDGQGTIQAMNAAAEALFNRPRKRLINQPLIALIVSSDQTLIAAQLKHLPQSTQLRSPLNYASTESHPIESHQTESHQTESHQTSLTPQPITWRSVLLQDQEISILPRQQASRLTSLSLSTVANDSQWNLHWTFRPRQRQFASATLQQREAFLSSIYNGANEAIFVIDVIDEDFYYAGLNVLAEQYGGVSSQAARHKTPEAAFGPTLGAVFRKNYERCLQAGISITYEEHLKAAGIWTVTTLSPLRSPQGQIDRIIGTSIDISDRKLAEETLRQNEQKLRAIFDSTFQFIGLLSLEGKVIDANRTALDAIGAERTAIIGQFFWETPWWNYFPEEQQKLQQAIQQAAQGEFIRFETKHRLADGTIAFVDFSLKPILDETGEIVMLIPEGRDITARKQAEAQLLLSQVQFEALVTNMPGMVYRYFPTTAQRPHHFTFVSQHVIELLELTPDTILQDVNTFVRLIHPDDLVSFTTSVAYSAEYFLPWHWEGRIITPSGRLKWVQGNSQAQETQAGEAWDGLLVDISDRKLAEQKIRQQATLLDIASDAICVHDLDNRVLYWNQGAERLYGWSAAEAIDQLANQLLESDPVQLETIMQQLLDRDEWRGELQPVTKTGEKLTVEARWTLVRDETNQPKFILTVSTDITEQKQLETQFYRAQRLESLGTLASGIAHDLNNVLTPILAISQLLHAHHPNSDARTQEMLKILEDSAKRGATMIQQILTFTRGTNGDRSLVQLTPLLQEVVQVIQQTFPKAIRIDQTIPIRSDWIIAANSTYLHQVLMNLCVNARDAMPHGGTLSISLADCSVDQTLAQANLDAQVGNHIVITVADTGIGIPESIRNHIFEPFFTTKAPGQGTGLGLSTVLGIVKDYGGFLQVVSEVGHGTQMKLYFPLVEEQLTPDTAPQTQFDGQHQLILVVDDDVAVQCSTQSLLESYHYQVLSTHRGSEAIQLYRQHQAEIKAVILDIMMPDMSGTVLIQRLKAINPSVKIIAMSGLLANREPALAAGATTFLPKPYMLEDLLQRLQSLTPSSVNLILK